MTTDELNPAAPLDPTLAPEGQAPGVRPWYVSALLALCAVVLMLSLAWLFARSKSEFPFYGTVYNTKATPFTGTDQDGRPFAFTPGQAQGQLGGRGATAIFFGFTNCPNICPLSLAYLDKVHQALPPKLRDQFHVVLVSVDPQRDTPARLKQYVTFFGQATGVNIPEPALAQVAKGYGVGYQKADIKSDTVYQMNHTTATYLVDQGGTLRVLWDYTQLPQVERVLADVKYVLEHPSNE